MKTLSPHDQVKAGYLRQLPLFATLSERELFTMAREVYLRHYDKGEYLFRAQTESTTLFALLKGCVQIFHTLPSGDKKVLHLLSPPTLMAEAAVLLGHPFPADGVATEEVLVFAIPRETLFALSRELPELPWRLMGGLFQRLMEFKGALQMHSRKSAQQRLALYLLGLFPEGAREVSLPAPKKQIANYLGLRPESFSRALKNLVDQGFLTEEEGTLTLLDRARLQQLLQE